MRERLEKLGVPTSSARYLAREGTLLAERTFSPEEQQIAVHRGELQNMLLDIVLERLGSDAVRTGQRVDGFELSDGVVNVTVTDRDSERAEKVTARVLLAAYGVHSSVRQQLHPDMSFHWEGTRMFRGTAVREPFLDGATMTLIDGEEEKRFLAYPIARDVENEGEELINWVAMVPEADSRTISGDDTKNEPTDPKDVVPTFRGWGFDWLDIEGLVAESTDVLRYPMTDREPLDSWGEGGVTFMGDAGHPMHPIGSNGGSQAILDGQAIAEHLTGVDLRDGAAVDTALRAYEDERRPVTNDVVMANRKLNKTERSIANKTQDELKEFAESGEFEEMQKKYAKGELDEL